MGKANEALYKSETQRRLELAGVEKTNADQNRSLEDSLRRMREEDDKRSAETNTRLQTSLATAGMTGVQKITTTAAGDLRGAAQSRDAQLKEIGPIDKSQGIAEFVKKTEEAAKISYEYKGKERQIGAQMVEQLEQERQRSADSHASTLTAGIFFAAATRNSGEQFGRGLGWSIGETMLTNFGKNLIFPKRRSLRKDPGQRSSQQFPGKDRSRAPAWLHYIRGMDPIKQAQEMNTRRRRPWNTAATRDLTQAYQSATSGTPAAGDTNSGFGVGVPGYSNFGSGTHGLTGPGSIVSAVKNVFTGTRKYTGPGVSSGAVEPVSQQQPQTDAGDLSPRVRRPCTRCH